MFSEVSGSASRKGLQKKISLILNEARKDQMSHKHVNKVREIFIDPLLSYAPGSALLLQPENPASFVMIGLQFRNCFLPQEKSQDLVSYPNGLEVSGFGFVSQRNTHT
ncbi:hypothetical protein VNO80_17216 [Phaseolus coccineus]|uniref:Uncharacterized protein n=1 Tax=Phaseolus coccineus TaxID=3886 RepID=A0AAN9R4Q2_PHACN